MFWLKSNAMVEMEWYAFNGTIFDIEGLDSNTAYHVMVQAIGPLGSINSTLNEFYTTPTEIKGIYN